MDDDFENIILDEEDNLNGVESLREKTKKNNNYNNNIIINTDIEKEKDIKINKNEEKEISEEYNDFNYNIEEEKDNNIINENNKIENIILTKPKEININEKNENFFSKNNLEYNNKIINEEKRDEQIIKQKEENNLSNIYNNDASNNSLNIIQNIEDNFISVKKELEIILTKVEFNEIKEITEQNNQLMEYITKLNDITNTIFKIFPKGDKLLFNKISKIRRVEKPKNTREEKIKKILDIYKNEYIDLEHKYNLIKDPIYKQSLLNILTKIKKEYEIICEENKKLKEIQKINEINIEKKSKNNKKEQNDVRRIEKDINNIKSQINLIKNKIKKYKINIIENNKRINQYAEKEKNLDLIAKEKYGIKEYQDINFKQNNNIKKIKEKKNSLKKIEIYEKSIETDKNKYEREIINNQIIINDLKNEKKRLLFFYKDLIGEKEFKEIIQNFKEENKEIIKENPKEKIEEINSQEKSDIINTVNSNEKSENDNKDNIITLKENNINNNKDKKYPEFLDFFKEKEENEENNNSENNINENNNSEEKEEKEINIAKFEEINSMSNRNKIYEDEPPPNEYEELEEFQI